MLRTKCSTATLSTENVHQIDIVCIIGMTCGWQTGMKWTPLMKERQPIGVVACFVIRL